MEIYDNRQLFNAGLDGVPQHHQKQFVQFANKAQSSSRTKELQSSKKFYSTFTETEDLGLQWKNERAKDVNISCIIATFKNLEQKTNIHLHRICKTAYPLYVWISHYYKELEPYLQSFYCVDIQKNAQEEAIPGDDPIKTAEEMIKSKEYNLDNIKEVASRLAVTLSKNDNPVNYVTCVKSPDDEILLTPVYKRQNHNPQPKLVIPPLPMPAALIPITDVSGAPLSTAFQPQFRTLPDEPNQDFPGKQFDFYNTFISITPEENKPGTRSLMDNDLIIQRNPPKVHNKINYPLPSLLSV